MPCYAPLRAVLISGPQGRRLDFKNRDLGKSGKGIALPCGRCIGCRLERSRQWAVRIVHESKMHDQNCFLTLTYAPEHLPSGGTLSVEHCQLFLKRLRFSLSPKRIRFFLCGEYGEQLGRPHYHMVLFGHDFPDKKVVRTSGEYTEYQSDELDQLWGLGGCRIGSVTFESASYVANYATKKITNKESYTDAEGKYWPSSKEYYGTRKPEFLLMSRKPGIGRPWFDRFYSDVYPSDEVISRGVKTRPPRFYDRCFEKLNGSAFERVKAKREAEAEKVESCLLPSGATVEVVPARNARRLAVREVVAKAQLGLKRRNLENAK